MGAIAALALVACTVTTTENTTDGGTSGTDSGSHADSSTGDSSTGTDSSTGADSGDDGGACVLPVSTGDQACDKCLQDGCCNEFSQCAADADCVELNNCVFDCEKGISPNDAGAFDAAVDGGIEACATLCQDAHPNAVSKFNAQIACEHNKCVTGADGGSSACAAP